MSSTALRMPVRLLVALLATVALMAGLSTGPAAQSAEAASGSTLRAKVIKTAATRNGMPYVYGAAGPTRFDCSGLTMWSYKQSGRAIPRTAQQQHDATRRVTRAGVRPGDLVFIHDSRGHVYHAGIYAGNWQMWDAPKPGRTVSRRTIWVNRGVSFGRV